MAATHDLHPRVRVADDKMSAVLTVPAGFPADNLDEAVCSMHLDAAGVKPGTASAEALRGLVEAHRAEPDAEHRLVVRGTPPVHGVDGRLELDDAASDARSTAGDDGGSVDHYARTPFVLVESGAVIGRVVPPVEGQDGVDVTGGSAAARVGQTARVTTDGSVLVDASGRLIAQVAGSLSVRDEAVKVSTVLEVPRYVDFESGNVGFDGDVRVNKGVRDHFVVEATGHVVVNGLVEAASVRAGGDVTLVTGMAGKGHGELRCRADGRAKYLEQTRCEIGRDLVVDRDVLHCQSAVGRRVRLPNGSLIGGVCYAFAEVEVGELGGPGCAATVVHLGALPKQQRLAERTRAELDALQAEAESIQQRLDTLQREGVKLTADQKERVTTLMCEHADVTDRRRRLSEAADRVQAASDRVRRVGLTAHRMIHEGSVLVAGSTAVRFVESVRGPVDVQQDAAGRLVFRTGAGGAWRPIGAVAEPYDRQSGATAA